jgi:hypothetical protein
MSMGEQGLNEFENAVLEDAWYELEGAYEVYALGRCRFVLAHCRAAMLIGIILLARKRDIAWSESGIDVLGRTLGMPEQLLNSCMEIELAGKYGSILKKGRDDQEHTAAILSKTLEAFEWMRGEIGTG